MQMGYTNARLEHLVADGIASVDVLVQMGDGRDVAGDAWS